MEKCCPFQSKLYFLVMPLRTELISHLWYHRWILSLVNHGLVSVLNLNNEFHIRWVMIPAGVVCLPRDPHWCAVHLDVVTLESKSRQTCFEFYIIKSYYLMLGHNLLKNPLYFPNLGLWFTIVVFCLPRQTLKKFLLKQTCVDRASLGLWS